MSASECFRSGDLAGAVAAAIDAVKSSPSDSAARWLLAEFSVIAGDFDRADRQLDTLGQQNDKMAPQISIFRHLIRAELARREVFDSGRVPEFLGLPSEPLSSSLKVLTLLRSGETAEAASLIAARDEARGPRAGDLAGQPFDQLRDLDDLLSPLLEVLTTTGKYYWVDWENIELLEFKAPERPRDLYWREAHIVVCGGPDGIVYVPAIYEGTAKAGRDELKLGRATDWDESIPGLVRGTGQRVLLVGDEDKSLMDCSNLAFQSADRVDRSAGEA